MARAMKKSKLPKIESVQELADFWDSHDCTDFEEELEEVTEPVFERRNTNKVLADALARDSRGTIIVAIHDQRKDYNRFSLHESDLAPDPIRQFEKWFEEALLSDVVEPNAMSLATATPEGRPSVRIVLLRGVDLRGFAFFTNYDSRKGRELDANPHAALVFFWQSLERQVRVEGQVERVGADESDRYFQDRPLASRLGAWASPQSEVIAGRELLEERCRELESRFANGNIPRPANWGGYRVVPESIEFWQGGPGRLHDRLRYTKRRGGDWLVERLAP
jgi:pyridoxamine 5'-phosphate oxidase